MFEDNEYWYVILLKGWWWTVMDEHADGAQPRDDGANGAHNMQGKWIWFNSLVFCCFVLYLNCMVVFLWKYVPHMQLQLTCTYQLIWFELDVKMFVRIVQQMKQIDDEKYVVDIKQEYRMRIMNIDLYVICWKADGGLWLDDIADGAHQGMTMQMEHTTCKDPLTDEAAVVSEFDFILLSLVSELYGLPFYANMCPTCNCNWYVHINHMIWIRCKNVCCM